MIPSMGKINKEKFRPRATRCSHCPQYEKVESKCKIFMWLIDKKLAKKQAVCDERLSSSKIEDPEK